MNEQRIQAYINLIQQLLTCPNGEETQILNQSLDLLDAGFVQVCEREAAQLQEQGEENRAAFLQNLAQQVAAFLNQQVASAPTNDPNTTPDRHSREGGNPSASDHYLPFLRELLQLEIDSNSDPKVVYPFLAQHTDQLNLTFAATAQQWFHSQLDPNDSQKNQDLARNFHNLAIDIKNFPLGSRLNNLEIAITLYQAALAVLTREAFPQDWAMTQNNLAIAYSDRIKGERAENLERAIGYYQAALEVYTREAFPYEWATVQNGLANAYSDRIKGERAENLEMAIGYYQAALEVRTREAFPEQWAMTQNNLAIAYLYRIKGERAENLEMAIGYYQAALEVLTREAFPEDWAMTQNNLAIAYRNRIKGERAENLEKAIGYYQAALEVYTRQAFPEDWAMTQNNLAAAYLYRIKGERAENLEMAIDCYQAALEVRTREAFPEQWAMTQNNLAIAYNYRIKGERAENLESAIGCYQAALAVRTREAFPLDHTQTLFNLGLAYRKAAQLENAAKTFADAIDTVEEIRSNIIIGGEAARQKLAAEWNKLYVSMVEVCLELEDYAAALEYAERGKARNLVELMAATRLKPEGVTPEVWERYDRLYQQWWNLQQQRNGSDSASDNGFGVGGFGVGDSRSVGVSASSTQKAVSEEISQRIGELNQQIDDLIAAEITPHDPKFRFGQKVEPIRYQEIQALVDEQTAIVEWYFTDEKIQAFIVTHRGEQPIVVSTDSHTVEALEQLKDEYLSDYLTDDYQWRQQLPSYLQRLAEILELDRLLSQIPDYCQQLILVPYRFLHLFPLHALPVGSACAPLGKVESPLAPLGKVESPLAPLGKVESPLAPLGKGGEEVAYLSDCFPQGIRYAPSSQILQISLSEATGNPTDADSKPPFPTPSVGGIDIADADSKPPLSTPSVGGIDIADADSKPPFLRGVGGIDIADGTTATLFAIQNPTGDLDYTDIEVEAIQSVFNLPTILKAEKASKTAFKQAETILKETGFAHFSCHGYFNFANPQISGLILADAKLPETATEPDVSQDTAMPCPYEPEKKPEKPRIRSRRGEFDPDECLTLPEIFNLRLGQCRLVALSACETGITDISTNSDEYISILAGFFFAGARNVLGTLWAVNDVSTAIFMIHFYETLLGEKQPPVALALKQTQEWMRSTTVADLLNWVNGCALINQKQREEMGDVLKLGYRHKLDVKRYASPYYWAGFCAVGQ